MKQKKIIIPLLILSVLLSCFLVYKGFYLIYCNSKDYYHLSNIINFKDTVKINTIKSDNYLTYNNLKIRNDFDKFTKKDIPIYGENGLSYILENDDKIIAGLVIKEDKTIIDTLLSAPDLETKIAGKISIDNAKKVLEKNNINNDIKYLKYLRSLKDIKQNIFTSITDIKGNFLINYYSLFILENEDNISLIEGDYEGYIFNFYDMKTVNILKNNKRYIIRFMGTNYFTDEYINELLNTIVID